MEIQTNYSTNGVGGPNALKKTSKETAIPQDEANFTALQSLEAMLTKMPDIRPDVIQETRSALQKAGYPPAETIQKISNLLAMELTQTNPV
jgi:hypothetical protein